MDHNLGEGTTMPTTGSQLPQIAATPMTGGSITSAIVLTELATAYLVAKGENENPEEAVIAKATELIKTGACPNIVNRDVMSGSMFCVVGMLSGLLPEELFAMLKSQFPGVDPLTSLNDVSHKMQQTKQIFLYQGTLAEKLKVSTPFYLDRQMLLQAQSEKSLIGKDVCFVSKKYPSRGHPEGYFYVYQLLVEGDSDPPIFLDKDICRTLTREEPPGGPQYICGRCTEVQRGVATSDTHRALQIASGRSIFALKI
ncbi:hypothetical protein Pelo_5424 [Pelomyxa schiedti]|nr:hypothetical protein Pelo_5424 [Pelomyxa schiedti]